MKNREIELKLSLLDGEDGLRPAALQQLLGATKAARSQKLETTYFDTTDGWLKRHGMALRIRRIGQRRIQTLKVPDKSVDGLQSFLEFDAEIKHARPQLQAISDARLRRRFDKARLFDKIRPFFTTRFVRSTWLLQYGESKIEVAFDRGEIAARTAKVPINEIEFELKVGEPVELIICAERLVEEIPAQLGHSTKAARGYALVAGDKAVPVRAKRLELPRKGKAGDAFAALARNCLNQLRANEAAVDQSEDDEAIHQFRVAIRRFRAGIGVYRKLIDDSAHAVMSIDLRWLQRQFGPARDMDVLIADTLVPMHARLRGQPLIGALLQTAEAARAEMRHQAHLALENPRYAMMLLHIYRQLLTGGWCGTSDEVTTTLDMPARDFADIWLNRTHKRLIRLGGEHAALSETELHRLRLLSKKMRYGAQAFGSLYSTKKAEKYLTHLGVIQNQLGSLNDAVVGRHLLVDLIARLARDKKLLPQEIGLLEGVALGWQSQCIAHDIAGFQQTWEAFRAQKKFWRED